LLKSVYKLKVSVDISAPSELLANLSIMSTLLLENETEGEDWIPHMQKVRRSEVVNTSYLWLPHGLLLFISYEDVSLRKLIHLLLCFASKIVSYSHF